MESSHVFFIANYYIFDNSNRVIVLYFYWLACMLYEHISKQNDWYINKNNICTYENTSLNSLNIMPLFGVNALDASQNALNMHALPSYPCLKLKKCWV